MNLTNFRETPIARVVEFDPTRSPALRRRHSSQRTRRIDPAGSLGGCGGLVHPTGSIRQRADSGIPTLFDVARTPPQSESAPSFIEELAAPTPTPGGGSAAAYAGAMGAGLVAMVAGLTIGKKKYAEVEAEMQAIRVVAENLRKELTQAVDDDASAFEVLMGDLQTAKRNRRGKSVALDGDRQCHAQCRAYSIACLPKMRSK